MIGLDMLGEGSMPLDRRGRVYGVSIGVVTNNQDPNGLGRVKVKLPWLSDTDESNWARVMTPMAGKDRGLYLLPEPGDEVLVMFDQGRVDHPFVIGALWNGEDTPPASNADGENNLRVLKSRSGHTITLDDTAGKEKITIADKTGNSTIVLDAAAGTVSITSQNDLTLSARGDITLRSSEGDVAVTCKSFKVNAETGYDLEGGKGKIAAEGGISIDSMAGVNVNEGALEVR